MSRSRILLQQSRRALAAGVVFSVLAHAAVFALLRFEVAPFQRTERTITFDAAPAAPTDVRDPAMEVVRITPVDVLLAPALSSAASSDAGSSAAATAAPTAASSAAPAASPAIAAVADLSYDQLVVLDPVTRAAVAPVSFDALTVAVTTAPAEADKADVPVYVPGSIGKAKRGWASSGTGETDRGQASGWTFGVTAGTGDGHCPMPGRGGRIPPTRGPDGGTLRGGDGGALR